MSNKSGSTKQGVRDHSRVNVSDKFCWNYNLISPFSKMITN